MLRGPLISTKVSTLDTRLTVKYAQLHQSPSGVNDVKQSSPLSCFFARRVFFDAHWVSEQHAAPGGRRPRFAEPFQRV